jgi:aryl-alcohol dehydrogenase-like predicted oxidoreductase
MKMRKLGALGPQVSAIGLGCMGMSEFYGPTDDAAAIEVLHRALSLGINFFDTADMYGPWTNESLLGKAFAGRRQEAVIATKFGIVRDAQGGFNGVSGRPDYVRSCCDASLRRLKTDYIDLYYCHRDDPNTPIADALGTLNELVKAGKIRHIAASNYSAARLREALDISQSNGYARFVALQPHYNLIVRGEYEGDLAALCEREGLSCFPYYSLAAGFLTGKYRTAEQVKGAAREARVGGYIDDVAWRVLAAVDAVAARHKTTNAIVALAWLLAQPTVAAPIASASRVSQVEGLLAAVQLKLTREDLAELDTASRR